MSAHLMRFAKIEGYGHGSSNLLSIEGKNAMLGDINWLNFLEPFPMKAAKGSVSLRLKGMRGEGEVLGLLLLMSLAAWFTHLYVCFTGARWGFLIAGALFFPVAIVHGVGIWLNIW